MAKRTRVSISLSASLRHRVEEAREASGRSVSDEIEAQLRKAFRQHDGDELLLVKHDCWFAGTVPLLPSPIREANMSCPKYRRLAEGRDA